MSYPAFAQQQQADAAATAFGETDTSIFAPVWCNRREPSMGDVPWGDQRVGAPTRALPPARLSPAPCGPDPSRPLPIGRASCPFSGVQ